MDVAEILKGIETAEETAETEENAVAAGEDANSQTLANLDETGEAETDADDPETAEEDTEGTEEGEENSPLTESTEAEDPDANGEESPVPDPTENEKRARAVGRKAEPSAKGKEPEVIPDEKAEQGTTTPDSDGLDGETRKQILAMYKEAGFNGKTIAECAKMKKAETMGVTVEELDRREEDERILAEAKKTIQKEKFERMIDRDLQEIRRAYPEMQDLGSVLDFDDPKRYGTLRDKGLTASEAFLVTNRAGLEAARKKKKEAAEAAAVKQEGKSHLTSDAARNTASSDEVPPDVRKVILGMYPDLSDKELKQLYRKSRNY